MERQKLFQTLSDLPATQFEQILFTLRPPGGVVPIANAPQGERVAALLAWVETTGPGLSKLQGVLYGVVGQKNPDLPAVCPYKGLSYFDCNDEDYKYFYGREALTQTLLDRISRDNFLAIVGASGSGKSSVLRAGLLQRLKDKGDSEIRILVPGEHPLQSLARAFIDESSDRLDRAAQQAKAEALIESGADGLRRLVQNSDASRVVLVVDQFEEAFTLCQDSTERQTFFETLLGGLEAAPSKLCLILTMRSDFVGKCFEQHYGGLAKTVQSHLESVLPMTTEELTQAIEEPARQSGVSLEPGLTTALLKDVRQSPGGLPLLQYTLTELWYRQQDNQLKLSVYHQLGGVTGTLKQRADKLYESLTPEQQQTAKHIFLSLTQLGEGAEDTRRRITQDSLVSSQHPENRVTDVVKQLADANLVVTDDQGKQRTATVDVAHEALIRNWPKLRQWLDEDRDLLRQQRKIELAANEWKQQDRNRGYLLQGLPLIEAKQFRKKHDNELPLSELATTFIQTSLRQQQINRLKTASWLLIPAALVVGLVDYSIRENSIKADYARLDSDSKYEEKQAVQDLVAGCSRQQQVKWLPSYVGERIFGYCRSLIGARLSESDLNSAFLRNAFLRNADLSDADLRNADLSDADLRNADLRNAVLHSAVLHSADLSSADLSSADLSYADLSDAELSYADLNYADLFSADLSNAVLFSADLSNAELSYAELNYADLSYARNLTEGQLVKAQLCRTTLPDDITLDPNRDCGALGIDPETGE